MTLAGWTPENQEWKQTIFGWRNDEAADAYFADPRVEELIFSDPRVVAVLTDSAIPLREAWKRGVRYIRNVSGKEGATLLKRDFGNKRIPSESNSGLVIPHFALDGTRTLQYRPNVPYVVKEAGEKPRPRKYDWGFGGGNGISIGYNAALRIASGTARRLAIVEGTKQAIAADIYAPDEVAVVGIQGIWNGQKEGELLEDLDTLARQFHDITVIPDGDVTSNPYVWDGAALLCELLWDASTADLAEAMEGLTLGDSRPLLDASAERAPRIALLPAQGKDGLDDLLGRLDAAERADFVADTLTAAVQMTALPERPGVSDGPAPDAPVELNVWQRFDATVGASLVVETLYGGVLVGNELVLSGGNLRVGRFDRGAGPEFVKTTDGAIARQLGIQANKVATASTLLIGAVGGKLAWRVLSTFNGAPDALIEWMDDNAERLREAADELAPLRRKLAGPTTYEELIEVCNQAITVTELGGDPSIYKTASDFILALAHGNTVKAARDMKDLITPKVTTTTSKEARA